MATRKTAQPPRIETYKHDATRKNIPTEELRAFAPDEAEPPKLVWPRNPDLDPQLVWTGKDEQDCSDLEVPVVPVYIQEKIQPMAIIEDLRAQSRGDAPPQLSLFGDFNGLPFDELIDFYQHEQGWTNRMILGDSLLVMTSLAEKEGLRGKVQTIYIDPPYGIKFGSNWQASTSNRNVTDSGKDVTLEPEVIRAFRDTWELGISSYLSYLRDRFVAARELLADGGSIFVQIGDENVHLVRSVLDEVMGAPNFVAIIPFRKKTMPFGARFIEQMDDYLLWYARDVEKSKFRPLFVDQTVERDFHYQWAQLPDGRVIRLTPEQVANHSLLPTGARVYTHKSLEPSGPMDAGRFDFTFEGRVFAPPKNGFCTDTEGMGRLDAAARLGVDESRLRFKLFADDFPVTALTAPWQATTGPRDKVYAVQTSTAVVQRCLLMTTDPGDLVLDPTCGSGTTAYVAEQWGRRWITIDTSRVALALARTRLMAGRFPYYLLADSQEGLKQEAEITGQMAPSYRTRNDLRKGFVYKRVPHVTLKSIANNPDIHEGMTREQIDAAIARHADTELLYDQPYQDNRRVRVTGPFTVESLSPHRVLADDVDRPQSEIAGQNGDPAGQFENVIIENLRAGSVQTTRRRERLTFTRLEHFPGAWIQAAGEYVERGAADSRANEASTAASMGTGSSDDGDVSERTKTVAVSIGPEYGTVTSNQVKEAAKEAMRGAGFDLLLVLGFGFDAHAGETAAEFQPEDDEVGSGFVAERRLQYGKLPILLVRISPELWMGEGVLKKTAAANLFTVFGEPDIDIRQHDGQIVIEVRGVDVYDPTSGQIRSSSTDEIACWFLDTSYNGESFFVRHAYFTGAGDPYKRLKTTLKSEIDEAAWASLYSTVSRPFDPPATDKIAVKVINHYGDEVLKVYGVEGVLMTAGSLKVHP